MSIGKIILASFVAIVVIGIISFVAMIPVTDVQTSPEITNEPKQENIEPISIPEEPQITPEIQEKIILTYTPKEKQCTGDARCISGFVTRIIDGDTIIVDGQSIRFALVDTPEYGDYDFSQARSYIETICPVGSKVIVDEDDGQTQGSYGRIIAKIYCNEINLNEAILEVGHAEILTSFCSESEFAAESWAQKHGCALGQNNSENNLSNSQSPSIQINCDPSYPDICIPPSPPDLDCGEIQYTNFKVLQPDPHRFDGDKDGIGCEK